MLILRDVLEFPAAEAADLLGTTTTAVNSGLRRARAQLAQVQPAGDELAEPADAGQRALLDRFAAAFENADASALAELLREDVALEMPPLLTWFSGRQTVVRFIASRGIRQVRACAAALGYGVLKLVWSLGGTIGLRHSERLRVAPAGLTAQRLFD